MMNKKVQEAWDIVIEDLLSRYPDRTVCWFVDRVTGFSLGIHYSCEGNAVESNYSLQELETMEIPEISKEVNELTPQEAWEVLAQHLIKIKEPCCFIESQSDDFTYRVALTTARDTLFVSTKTYKELTGEEY